jgi:hypothetical protein
LRSAVTPPGSRTATADSAAIVRCGRSYWPTAGQSTRPVAVVNTTAPGRRAAVNRATARRSTLRAAIQEDFKSSSNSVEW